MKKKVRYIRYRICRAIYYADQCPIENRKDYSSIGKNVLMGAGVGLGALVFAVLMVTLA